MRTSSKMGLRIWNLLLDNYDHEQLADNWAKIDAHDHTPGRGVLIPSEGIADEAIVPRLLSPTIFPVVSAVGGTLTLSAAEEKVLPGGPELVIEATGEYEVGLLLTGEVNANTLAILTGSIRVNGVPTFDLFDFASATQEAKQTTTNFVRAELSNADILTVGCKSDNTTSCTFSNARLSVWKVQ
jgi:hypothetical protein